MKKKTGKNKVLVTGGAGFIGSHLVDTLIKKGFDVIVIDNLSTSKRENLNPKAKFYKKDIRNLEKIKPLFKGIDYVFHLAARARVPFSVENPIESHTNNVLGTLNVLVASRDAGIKKLIYASSSSIYGNQEKLPLKENMTPRIKNPYALQKLMGEEYCRLFHEWYNLSSVCLRYFNVYGPRLSFEGSYILVLGILLQQKIKGEPLTVEGDGEQTRDFTYIDDVVRASILAMESNKVGKAEVINIGAGDNHSINELARMIGGKTVKKPARKGDVRDTLADITKASKLLAWKPRIKFKEGIGKVKEWFSIDK